MSAILVSLLALSFSTGVSLGQSPLATADSPSQSPLFRDLQAIQNEFRLGTLWCGFGNGAPFQVRIYLIIFVFLRDRRLRYTI